MYGLATWKWVNSVSSRTRIDLYGGCGGCEKFMSNLEIPLNRLFENCRPLTSGSNLCVMKNPIKKDFKELISLKALGVFNGRDERI